MLGLSPEEIKSECPVILSHPSFCRQHLLLQAMRCDKHIWSIANQGCSVRLAVHSHDGPPTWLLQSTGSAELKLIPCGHVARAFHKTTPLAQTLYHGPRALASKDTFIRQVDIPKAYRLPLGGGQGPNFQYAGEGKQAWLALLYWVKYQKKTIYRCFK